MIVDDGKKLKIGHQKAIFFSSFSILLTQNKFIFPNCAIKTFKKYMTSLSGGGKNDLRKYSPL